MSTKLVSFAMTFTVVCLPCRFRSPWSWDRASSAAPVSPDDFPIPHDAVTYFIAGRSIKHLLITRRQIKISSLKINWLILLLYLYHMTLNVKYQNTVNNGNIPFSLLVHLRWNLKWAFLIAVFHLSINFSYFHLLLQNHWSNFNQTKYLWVKGTQVFTNK